MQLFLSRKHHYSTFCLTDCALLRLISFLDLQLINTDCGKLGAKLWKSGKLLHKNSKIMA